MHLSARGLIRLNALSISPKPKTVLFCYYCEYSTIRDILIPFSPFCDYFLLFEIINL